MTITNDNTYQEVYYWEYCPKCKHWEKDNALKEPCDHCMNHPVNLYSHKPVCFVEASKT